MSRIVRTCSTSWLVTSMDQIRDAKTPHYVKVDWDKWVDKDDTGTNDLGMEDMDFSSLGGMGGMSGMNDLCEERNPFEIARLLACSVSSVKCHL